MMHDDGIVRVWDLRSIKGANAMETFQDVGWDEESVWKNGLVGKGGLEVWKAGEETA